MLKITFKNVGQGDSIILEWGRKKTENVGIIDCNQFYGNPVLDHIINLKIKSLDFVILSHPHYDHFSGMLELIKYCFDNKIKVKSFVHTSEFSPDFIKSAIKSKYAERSLAKLFKFINDNYFIMGMKIGHVHSDSITNELPLDKVGVLKILSPSYGDKLKFINSQKYKIDEEGPNNNPNANILSTICEIKIKSGFLLLTSDTNRVQLDRIGRSLNSVLLLGQSPHHGAKDNHSGQFWHNINRNAQTPIVFSVGPNKYGHPSTKAIKSFEKNDYNLHFTNSSSRNPTYKSSMLNYFSEKKLRKSANTKISGDQVFTFQN